MGYKCLEFQIFEAIKHIVLAFCLMKYSALLSLFWLVSVISLGEFASFGKDFGELYPILCPY